MYQKKKNTGKGHTLYEYDLPKGTDDIWLLIAESCYEISQTLLAQNSFASEISLAFSGYDYQSSRGGFALRPEGFVRYPLEIYQNLYREPRSHKLIAALFSEIRRVQVRVSCEPYVTPLFYEEGKLEKQFRLLEKVRSKFNEPDAIGMGLEGFRKHRIKTYTPKRSDEIRRAIKLLKLKPQIFKLLGNLAERCYWYRLY